MFLRNCPSLCDLASLFKRRFFVLSVKLTNIHLDESDSGVPFYCQIKHNVVIDPGVVAATFAPGKQTMSICFAHEFINVQVLSGRAQKNGVTEKWGQVFDF